MYVGLGGGVPVLCSKDFSDKVTSEQTPAERERPGPVFMCRKRASRQKKACRGWGVGGLESWKPVGGVGTLEVRDRNGGQIGRGCSGCRQGFVFDSE